MPVPQSASPQQPLDRGPFPPADPSFDADLRWPDPAWQEARDAWMAGASLRDLFGTTTFDLQDSVGSGRRNQRGDVFRLQALLHREGDLDAAATGGPTGYWGGRDDAALRRFQKTNGLTTDGWAAPDGETLRALRGFYLPETAGSGLHLVQTDPPAPATRPPLLSSRAEREKSILDDTPGRFVIADSPELAGAAPLWRKPEYGRSMVERYAPLIDQQAREQGVDPDLVKAIMYFENADGHKYGLDILADYTGLSRSQRPMSIRSDIWQGLGLPPENARDPALNIATSVRLIRRITDRLEQPTPEKIGTLWNSLAQDRVSDRGARIGRVFRERLWEKGPKLPDIDLSNGWYR